MGQQVPQGDRPLCRTQLRKSFRIESVEDLRRAELRIDIRHRSVQRKLALFDKLQRGHRSDRLDHRGDAKHRIARHGRLGVKAAAAENALVDDVIVGRGQCHDAGHLPGARCGAQHRVDLGKGSRAGRWSALRRAQRSRGPRPMHRPSRASPSFSRYRGGSGGGDGSWIMPALSCGKFTRAAAH